MNSRVICRPRRGFTLVEVGISVTLAAIVLGGATARTSRRDADQ